MPRTARKKSKSGIYHIMMRGINHQDIFEDDEDKDRFLQTIVLYKEQCEFELLGYCLMSNHIHLLMKDDNLGTSMRKICASYVHWYNTKYQRCGHLYQDRFKSENIENMRYLLTVIRYIHQNPVKAGIVSDISDYKWSSYHDYFMKHKIVDSYLAFSIMPEDQFLEYHNEQNQDNCLEYLASNRFNDNEAREAMRKMAHLDRMDEIQSFTKASRDEILRNIKAKSNFSIRQIARVTGISRRVIEEL
ncbi:MAG: transposase [Negativicutes bacterium]|nr:transposase [Negativicutes bacterium]